MSKNVSFRAIENVFPCNNKEAKAELLQILQIETELHLKNEAKSTKRQINQLVRKDLTTIL